MASIADDPGGKRRILFVAPYGTCPAIRLGKVSQRAAESVKNRVEQLLEGKLLNRPMDAESANGARARPHELRRGLPKKIVRRAGLQPWPRLFHNLRASRETELVESFPVQVVTTWLGNTPKVAMQHYLMTTDEHFARAIGEESKGAGVAQNAAQQAHAVASTEPQTIATAQEKAPGLPGLASSGDFSQLVKIAGTGFEPVTSRL